MGKCTYNEPWVGDCKEIALDGKNYCMEHINKRCVICGKQATHGCPETSFLVCGYPLCDNPICKIKHHPEHYKFTPKTWAKIYEENVSKEMFGEQWESDISYREFRGKLDDAKAYLISRCEECGASLESDNEYHKKWKTCDEYCYARLVGM